MAARRREGPRGGARAERNACAEERGTRAGDWGAAGGRQDPGGPAAVDGREVHRAEGQAGLDAEPRAGADQEATGEVGQAEGEVPAGNGGRECERGRRVRVRCCCARFCCRLLSHSPPPPPLRATPSVRRADFEVRATSTAPLAASTRGGGSKSAPGIAASRRTAGATARPDLFGAGDSALELPDVPDGDEDPEAPWSTNKLKAFQRERGSATAF